MLTDDQLAAIRDRAQAATPGPWEHHERHPFCSLPGVWRGNEGGFLVSGMTDALEDADASFIAHAREDVPALLAEVDRLRAEVDSANRREAHINQALNEGDGVYRP